jgi:hypothetical protein
VYLVRSIGAAVSSLYSATSPSPTAHWGEHMSIARRPQMAAVYRIGEYYLLHAHEQAPPGFWVGVPPYERLTEDVGDAELGQTAVDCLGRSRPMVSYQPTRAAQDGELIKAAGFRSRKRFVEAAQMCTLRRDAADWSRIRVSGWIKDPRRSAWVPDDKTTEVDGTDLPALGQAIRTVLWR